MSETVVVTSDDEQEPATVEDNSDESVTVIVDTTDEPSTETVSESELERAVDTAVDIERLQTRVNEIDGRLVALESRSVVTEATTEAVAETVEEMAEVVTETAADTADDVDLDGDGKDDVIPDTARKHWLFRSRDEWRRS